jgi:hypothetical protein
MVFVASKPTRAIAIRTATKITLKFRIRIVLHSIELR